MKNEGASKAKKLFWLVAIVAIGVFGASQIFSVLEFTNFDKLFRLESHVATIAESIGSDSVAEPGPGYFYLNKNTQGELENGLKVSALAYLVGDINTGEVILSKNQDTVRAIASISKLMTALVADEISKPDESTVVSKSALSAYGTNGGLRLGEKIKVADLFYPLLLESSNDAAEVLAEHFERESFLNKMNLQASSLLMDDTSYEDPSGLSAYNQSTASDIFKLTGYLSKKKQELLEITTKRSFSNGRHSWSNINPLSRESGYLGGKTGYTDKAMQTVVSLFSLPLGENEDRPVAIVLLGSNNRSQDVKNILKYLEKNIYYGGKSDANTDWVLEKVGLPSIKDPDFVTLTFLGDMMLDRGVRRSVIKNFNNDYSSLFEKLDMLKDSDVVFANLEGTASDQGSDLGNLYSFRMDPGVIPALAGAGINVLSVANNHIGDWGRDAYTDTLRRLTENEILYTGGGMDKARAEQPAVIERYGIKLGFLGFSDLGPRYMEAKEERAGILLASDPRFEEIIENASRQVDYLVVSFHFGDEYKPIHNARQENLSKKAVDSGAKIVIGHHPHVIQDTEVYKNSFIAYSAGNFIFDQSWSKPTMEGMLLEIKLRRNGNMSIRADTIKLNSAFQPEKIIKGVEQKLEF